MTEKYHLKEAAKGIDIQNTCYYYLTSPLVLGKDPVKNCKKPKVITIIIIWTLLRKGNLKRETESPLIEAQNNVIKTMSKQE